MAMTPPDLRASDADRDRLVESLSAHAGAGRLDAAEFGQRVSAALSARTLGELEALRADLPQEPAAVPRPSRSSRRRLHGLRPYLAVMVLLVAIWALTGAGYLWPVWPALGWGIGLLAPGGCHARGRARGRRLTAG